MEVAESDSTSQVVAEGMCQVYPTSSDGVETKMRGTGHTCKTVEKAFAQQAEVCSRVG